jgi:hypothetical protein
MKKMFVFLLLILAWSEVNGQGHPIKPYRETDYSVSEVRQFSLNETKLSSNWRKEFLRIINDGLYSSGENMVLNESNICWIFDHITYERRNLINFTNSMRNNNDEIKFFPDKSFDGMVAVFNYNQCSLVIYKTRCMNLLKVQQIAAREQFSPTVEHVVYDRPVRPYLNEWQPIQPIVERSVIIPTLPIKEKKSWFIKALVYFVGASAIATGTYLLCNRRSTPSTLVDNGGPGGAPITPAVPDNGGPGGAQTTP